MSHAVVLEKANVVSTDVLVENILSVYAKATESDIADGSNWYMEANSFACEMAIKHNVSLETAVAVIAHLSPRLMWDIEKAGDLRMTNKKGADAVLGNGILNGLMAASVKNAVRAIDSDDPISTLNGSKVKAFAANILGNTERVTIDVWALRIAFGTRDFKDSLISRKGMYEAIEDAYQIAAAKVGIAPSTLQAITWVVIRKAGK